MKAFSSYQSFFPWMRTNNFLRTDEFKVLMSSSLALLFLLSASSFDPIHYPKAKIPVYSMHLCSQLLSISSET